ncbi:MAG: hypothetical protein WCR46_06415 [Deltaproteobacteria bacterium]
MKPSYPKRSGLFDLMEKSLTTIFYFLSQHTLRTSIILRFTPTPTLPRWERELMEIADYARSQHADNKTIFDDQEDMK